MTNPIPNVLASRYASKEMQDIWSATARITFERKLWIAVMEAQRDLGVEIPEEAIAAYKAQVNSVDLASIAKRERITKHDVKARIEEFCDLAGHQYVHMGMTSRDLTENVEQMQVLKALELIVEKAAGALLLLDEKAQNFKELLITARTHNVAAQSTTLGKRLAMFGEELHYALSELDKFLDVFPVRGLKGAVGTQLDSITLLGGDISKVKTLEAKVVAYLGFKASAVAVGQVYPRSFDYALVSSLLRLASAPSSFAKTLRIMAGHETASEGFLPGQVGSSAMPHKVNSRSCERINGFFSILRGYEVMLSGLAGDQWNEGDVSCSVVRRVALPDSFFAIDGLLETFISVLNNMEVFEHNVAKENAHYLPFLLTTTFLMEAVKKGVGREQAHLAIKEHALATVTDLRSGKIRENNLGKRISEDSRLKLSEAEVSTILKEGASAVGSAKEQVSTFSEMLSCWRERFPDAAKYRPVSML